MLMKAVELQRFGDGGLAHSERPAPKPAPGEVVVRVLAASLNYRDLEILEGRYGMPVQLPIVPLSDAVAEVVELGANTSRFSVGDKVNPLFFPDWLDGPFRGEYFQRQRGSSVSGVLQEFIAIPETALARAPRHLGADAAALPIAALTAWNALREAAVVPGQTVLIIGTGGVSLFALQFSRVFGAQAIVVSASPGKLERVKSLGAFAAIDSASTRPGVSVSWS
jgi:NADPH:quinone reductase-like Zn-dependent oxidoreductase